MISLREAATARAAQTRQVTDRPSRRRGADGGRALLGAPILHMELRAASPEVGALLTFEGIASATEREYEMYDAFGPYAEIVSGAAFNDTLQRDGLDVPLVLGHDQMRRIARTTNDTLTLAAVGEGLHVRATLDPTDPDVIYASTKIRAGLLDEMSFGFRIDSGTWSPDYTQYRINSVDLHRGDVSIVGWGANPFTTGGLRSEAPDLTAIRARQMLARMEMQDDAFAS